MKASATYDPDADALGIYFRPEGSTYDASQEVAPGLTLDFDTEGKVIGVEISGVQELLARGRLRPDEGRREELDSALIPPRIS